MSSSAAATLHRGSRDPRRERASAAVTISHGDAWARPQPRRAEIAGIDIINHDPPQPFAALRVTRGRMPARSPSTISSRSRRRSRPGAHRRRAVPRRRGALGWPQARSAARLGPRAESRARARRSQRADSAKAIDTFKHQATRAPRSRCSTDADQFSSEGIKARRGAISASKPLRRRAPSMGAVHLVPREVARCSRSCTGSCRREWAARRRRRGPSPDRRPSRR
jgi:hypothetical protein